MNMPKTLETEILPCIYITLNLSNHCGSLFINVNATQKSSLTFDSHHPSMLSRMFLFEPNGPLTRKQFVEEEKNFLPSRVFKSNVSSALSTNQQLEFRRT